MNHLIKKWAKDLIATSPKVIYRWQITVWKDAQHHSSVENYKIKQQWDTTTHWLERPNLKTLAIPNAGEDAEQQELSFIAGRCKVITATLQDSLVVSYKTEHIPTIWSSSCAPWYLCEWSENLCYTKSCTRVFTVAFIYNCQNLEINKTSSVSKWINKLWYIQTMGHYSVLKTNQLSSHEKT